MAGHQDRREVLDGRHGEGVLGSDTSGEAGEDLTAQGLRLLMLPL